MRIKKSLFVLVTGILSYSNAHAFCAGEIAFQEVSNTTNDVWYGKKLNGQWVGTATHVNVHPEPHLVEKFDYDCQGQLIRHQLYYDGAKVIRTFVAPGSPHLQQLEFVSSDQKNRISLNADGSDRENFLAGSFTPAVKTIIETYQKQREKLRWDLMWHSDTVLRKALVFIPDDVQYPLGACFAYIRNNNHDGLYNAESPFMESAKDHIQTIHGETGLKFHTWIEVHGPGKATPVNYEINAYLIKNLVNYSANLLWLAVNASNIEVDTSFVNSQVLEQCLSPLLIEQIRSH